MSTYTALTKAFIKSLSMSKSNDKRTRITMKVIVAVVVLFIFVPVAIFCSLMTYSLVDNLSYFHIQDLGVAMVFHMISLFSLFFGFNVIFSEFYFSSDIEFVRPWPVKAWELVASKFTVSFYVDNAMQVFMVIASLVGFFFAAKPGVMSYVASVFATITLPILPLCYCGILSMIVMRFTKAIKNKEGVQRVSAVVLAFLILIFVILFRVLASNAEDAVHFFVTETNSPFVEYMNKIFPTVHFISRAIAFGSVTDLLIYLLINVFAIALMLLVAELLYFKGFENLVSNGKAKARSFSALMEKSIQTTPFKAYFKKELMILVRTPSFFTNCVIPNFIWPVFVLIILKMQTYDASLTALRMYNTNRPKIVGFFLIVGSVVFSLIMTSLNSIASNAISREGKHFQFMKYIPVPYDMQWDIKVLVSFLLTFIGIWMYLLPACILIHINVIYVLVAIALSILSITFGSYMGVYIDSIQPKLVWDDELSVLRENTNVALSMGIALGISIAIGAVCYAFYAFVKVRLLLVSLSLFVLLALLNLFVLWRTAKRGKKNIAEQEEM
ncbi:MAG: hypothetical protein KBS82_02415 [Oscillospiraceae bacterium]|nr:hypothetical protein [Candidatus Limimonas egerieequi]